MRDPLDIDGVHDVDVLPRCHELRPPRTPEARLAVAVLADAVRDLRTAASAPHRMDAREHAEAVRTWMRRRSYGRISFETACSVIGLDPAATEAKLLSARFPEDYGDRRLWRLVGQAGASPSRVTPDQG